MDNDTKGDSCSSREVYNNVEQAKADLTSFQFVPNKIVDVSVTQCGARSYRVQWKDSWLTEELLALTYQHLISDFWQDAATSTNHITHDLTINQSDAAATSGITVVSDHCKSTLPTEPVDKTSPDVVSNIADSSHAVLPLANRFDVVATEVSRIGQHTNLLVGASQLLEENSILKSELVGKISDLDTCRAMMNDMVQLQGYSFGQQPQQLQATVGEIPKYQQALQLAPSVELVPIKQDQATGRSHFPKHVFSQKVPDSAVVTVVADATNAAENEGDVCQPAVIEKAKKGKGGSSNRVTCDICQKSLKSKKMLWAHKVSVHVGGNFPCETCGKRCITTAELKRHVTSHSNERQYVCQYCGLAYKRWSHLYQHLKVHEEEKNFRCDVCHENFKVQSELKDHCFSVHIDPEVSMFCGVCHNKLQTPLAVYNHSMRHTGTRDFTCDVCQTTFKRKQHLVTHMRTHYNEQRDEPESYACQLCEEETFHRKMDLLEHCNSMHSSLSTTEQLKCRTCDKSLSLPNSLYLHGLRHAGARAFICDICNYAFKRKSHLQRHTLDVHPETQQKSESTPSVKHRPLLTCRACTRQFKYRASLETHLAKRHGIVGPAAIIGSPVKLYRCRKCALKFSSHKLLSRHEITHDREAGTGRDEIEPIEVDGDGGIGAKENTSTTSQKTSDEKLINIQEDLTTTNLSSSVSSEVPVALPTSNQISTIMPLLKSTFELSSNDDQNCEDIHLSILAPGSPAVKTEDGNLDAQQTLFVSSDGSQVMTVPLSANLQELSNQLGLTFVTGQPSQEVASSEASQLVQEVAPSGASVYTLEQLAQAGLLSELVNLPAADTDHGGEHGGGILVMLSTLGEAVLNAT